MIDDLEITFRFKFCQICRWHDAFHSPDLTPHVLGAYRHFFDLQIPDEVCFNLLSYICMIYKSNMK